MMHITLTPTQYRQIEAVLRTHLHNMETEAAKADAVDPSRFRFYQDRVDSTTALFSPFKLTLDPNEGRERELDEDDEAEAREAVEDETDEEDDQRFPSVLLGPERNDALFLEAQRNWDRAMKPVSGADRLQNVLSISPASSKLLRGDRERAEGELRKLLSERVVFTKRDQPGLFKTRRLTQLDFDYIVANQEIAHRNFGARVLLNCIPWEEAMALYLESEGSSGAIAH